ncbi:MAG: membrane protein insertion efficiency factor YidD [Rhodospirillales bacterium]|nr:membrane protein insertion efficiency factor YidD [Rhodospirillales bacterium]MBO6787935.1 membrane protein insertion efficiency factor YidD [Rhodospirillales bacterium]
MAEVTLSRIVALPVRALIALYRYGISPFIPGTCRFHPSCSAYAEEAICTHGPFSGGFLAIRRILRCHPWGGSGYDPVPVNDPAQLANRKGSPEHP